MKPNSQRLHEALEGGTVVHNARDAYKQIYQIIDSHKRELEKEVWNSRIESNTYTLLRERYNTYVQIQDAIIALLDIAEGRRPKEPEKPKRRDAGLGYGER